MNAIDLIHRLHQHRAWVSANLLTAASSLSDEQLHRSLPIGQGSIWRSLVHMFAAEYVWLHTLRGDEQPQFPGDLPGHLPGNQLGEGTLATLAELSKKWSELERQWTPYLSSLLPEQLDEPVYKVVSSTGQRFATRRSDILLHVCTHAHYTAAQTVNMLRQLGAEKLPDTMLISLARK